MVLVGYDKEKYVYFNGSDEKAKQLQRALVVPLKYPEEMYIWASKS